MSLHVLYIIQYALHSHHHRIMCNFRYLEQRDATMHANANAVIKECYEKNKAGDPEYSGSLTVIMKARLRATVGEAYWKMSINIYVKRAKSPN